MLDPERTPTLWKLSHEGIICDNFYTPLWGVSTSDGEYVTTTGLIPKPGVWSYSESSDNYMPFGFGNQFQKLGYRTLAAGLPRLPLHLLRPEPVPPQHGL